MVTKIRIAICDDDKKYAERMKELIVNAYIEQKGLTKSIECILYSTAQMLVQQYLEDKIDIVFMDIELGEELGLDVAKQLKKIDDELAIVYMTNHDHYVFDAYVCRPLGFIRKSRDIVDLNRAMVEITYYINKKYATILLKDNMKNIELSIRDIRAIEVYNHNIVVMMKNKEFTVRDKLSRIEQILYRYDFIKISRSRMVNPMYIQNITGEKIYLYGDDVLEVSSRRIADVYDQWEKYQMKH